VSKVRPASEIGHLWLAGIGRHLDDLRSGSYEGESGKAREPVYREAFDLLTPVATAVLSEINNTLLASTAEVAVQSPESDGRNGLIGSWTLSWPRQREASNRFSGGRLRPVMISAVFPEGFVHPHLVAGGPINAGSDTLVAWPMQVTTAQEASAYEPLLWAIAAAEVHDRIYQSSWRIIPSR